MAGAVEPSSSCIRYALSANALAYPSDAIAGENGLFMASMIHRNGMHYVMISTSRILPGTG